MKNYLLKLSLLGCVAFMAYSCSEDETDSTSNDELSDLNLTDCVTCPEFEVDGMNGSGSFTQLFPEADVCKTENGRAYVNGVITEDTYDDFIRSRFIRCN